MRRTLIVGIVVTLAVLAPVGAQQPVPRQVMIYGVGNSSCGKWLRARKTNNDVGVSWVQGFVTGVGAITTRTLKGTDSAGIEVFVDQYCDAHPTNTVAEAAGALVRELEVKIP